MYPIHAAARNLPFAEGFFEAVVSIDAFPCFGTEDHFLGNLLRNARPGGIVAIAQAGFLNELCGEIPQHLAQWFRAEPSLVSMHSSRWWRQHWERTGLVDIETCDCLQDGWEYWLVGLKQIAPDINRKSNPLKPIADVISLTIE